MNKQLLIHFVLAKESIIEVGKICKILKKTPNEMELIFPCLINIPYSNMKYFDLACLVGLICNC